MSHHFDTPTAREDPRLNINDFYLFEGAPGKTVMAMTVNPDAGLSAPDTFRDEGLYCFRFDLDGDAKEEVTFKVRFGEPRHADGDEHLHIQRYQVLKAAGNDAFFGLGGELLIEGDSESNLEKDGMRAFAGVGPDLFAGDAVATKGFMGAFHQGKFNPGAFQNRQNFFGMRNASVIVLEVPNDLIGQGLVRAWATVSLVGHAPEVQVSRWGIPMLTHIFLSDPNDHDLAEQYNRSTPSDDASRFAPRIAKVAEQMTTYANSSAKPAEYGKRLASLMSPSTLPYRLGSAAGFDFAGFNGRALRDDVLDVIFTLAANVPLGDGVAPDPARIHNEFPYFGKRLTRAEQQGVAPAAQPSETSKSLMKW